MAKEMKNVAGELTFDDLASRQSVRATFKLSPEVVELVGVVAGQLGIKQKTLLDQLVEDGDKLRALAATAADERCRPELRRQKTFVLSRSSLDLINSTANSVKIPRDLLVEIAIKRLLPIVETELVKHHERKKLCEELREYLRVGEALRDKTGRLLGKNDVLYGMLNRQVAELMQNISEIRGIIERGTVMEDW